MVREHLKAFLEHLRLNENASAHTVRAYDSDLAQYLVFLTAHLKKRVSELQVEDLDHLGARAFMADLNKRGNSKSSAARKLSAIRAFGRYLRREGTIEGDPTALVGTPKREQRIPNHLAVQEMSTLLDAPDTSDPLGRRDKAILELFYASGLRLSELVGLDLDDVNVSGRVVRVLGKGRKERIVPFNKSTADALRAWLADREGVRPGSDRGQTPENAAKVRLPGGGSGNRCFSTTREDGCPRGAWTSWCDATWRSRARAWASARTPCGTHSRHIFWKRGRTCVRSRNCSVTRVSAPRSVTPT